MFFYFPTSPFVGQNIFEPRRACRHSTCPEMSFHCPTAPHRAPKVCKRAYSHGGHGLQAPPTHIGRTQLIQFLIGANGIRRTRNNPF